MHDLCINENLKVVLFNSPIYRNQHDDGETYLPPLGQGYIVTNLKKHGIAAMLIDCVYEHLSVPMIIDIINRGTFFYIGFNIFSVNLLLVKEILTQINRNVHIFLGGKAIEYLWREILKWNINYPITFIIGEGENIFPALILQKCKEPPIFDNGLHKVYLVNKDSYYYPFDLNCVNLDRTLFKHREILNRHGRYEACLIASRGCIYDCTFCGGAVSANPNITVRIRGYDSLVSEINDIIRISPRVSSIRILDDLFLRNRESIIDACKLFSSFPHLHWRCMAHINTFLNNVDLIPNMKNSGCDEVFIGIESGSPEIRLSIHKLGTIQNVIDVVRGLLAGGIHVKGYFMCGFPDETENQLRETLNLAHTLHNIAMSTPGCFRPVVFQFRPYHGTKLFNQLFQAGVDISYNRQKYLTSSKEQYNFSAGNFSKVSDEVLEEYIHQIDQLNE